jgi:hypothetical protein
VYYAYWKFVATATNLFSLETYSTNVNVEGNNGLPEGKYSLTITPDITVTCIKKEDNSGHYCGNRSNKIIEPINLL